MEPDPTQKQASARHSGAVPAVTVGSVFRSHVGIAVSAVPPRDWSVLQNAWPLEDCRPAAQRPFFAVTDGVN
jgi:hypothetical protein